MRDVTEWVFADAKKREYLKMRTVPEELQLRSHPLTLATRTSPSEALKGSDLAPTLLTSEPAALGSGLSDTVSS